jgi:methionyl-tRNA synthetase
LYDNGDYRTSTEQLYDAKADQFLADRFVTGTKCGNEEAYINVKMDQRLTLLI